jgi:hypothetical protein
MILHFSRCDEPRCSDEGWDQVRKLLLRRRAPARYDRYNTYLGAVAGADFAGCWTESFPMIAPLLNGGLALAGKSGRKTANAWEANAMETITIAAARFMVGGLIRF